MQITSQQQRSNPDGRALAALILGALSLLPCLWILGPPAYLLGAAVPGRVAQAGRVLGLAGSTFLLLAFVYAVATVAGVVASPH